MGITLSVCPSVLPRSECNALQVFTKIFLLSYNNAQIHPYITVQYLKCPSCPESIKRHEFILRFLTIISRRLIIKDLCRVQSKNVQRDGNAQQIYFCTGYQRADFAYTHYTCMQNLHNMSKSARVNGANSIEHNCFRLNLWYTPLIKCIFCMTTCEGI